MFSIIKKLINYSSIILLLIIVSCESNQSEMKKIIFLHHSTGRSIWVGKTNRYIYKLAQKGDVQKYFDSYNKKEKKNYSIYELSFPKSKPYGWENYPFDYYNLWVKNAGEKPFMEEPTLEILTTEYDVIIFKHCFPVGKIMEDTGVPNIDSNEKRIENYKLQYNALKDKMHTFPENKFIVWTPAVCTKNTLTEEEAKRTKEFHKWMTEEWDVKGDNIYIWDFYNYETEGGLFLLDKNAYSPDNCHPSIEFAGKIAPLFSRFVIEVIESEAS
jgi:hypothetical protein